MNFIKTGFLPAAILAVGIGGASACELAEGSVRILSNDFPALQAVTGAAAACATGGATVTANLTTEHRNIQVAALTADPAEYTSAVVSNSSLVPLLTDGLVRPLDDLIAAHGAGVSPNQKIMIDGRTMAIAFMANAQHLYYRRDILEAAGLEVPTTYEEVLAAAEAIRDQGLMEFPLGGTFKAGWNLAQEFVNMYLGHGGAFFEPGSAAPAINNAQGVAALEMMKALTAYMNPDFLTYDSNALQAEFEAGNVALANFWGSRAGGVTDAEGATPEIAAAIGFAAAPTVAGGTTPASTLWWDGFTIATNIPDVDAEASFVAMVHGASTEVANANPNAAVWLIDGYTPGDAAVGVLATAQMGTSPYPMLPYMSLMHTALGTEIVEFLQGSETAEQALSDVEASYRAAAREAGFLN
ncbi:extracellular solute-binding protein family 1 [Dinoroseobacter shibae DFL 12 = DSM 16493]|uniref:Extracellular solute-binding protein family 1 n=1 Tax=Dinoroseobacter shibae (strain DSM 16493 / NCIMB 14021 / DFL 12) TaxID=398580 RepID=A8LJD3_DINSH|nr:extracellular solute-binding protein [Dinoroseobacter shibae]ABV93155.1 extracellular solute-binding protein family 1 [Dinoroseobacter shibae DFL 12 = DSM 16493]URF48081.1 extracellular solute-binding protein [Dinoroseobacter shibae]URF52391.1 extracellular solute-binding protein [Dinoroseobacter shibae]